MSLYTEPNTYHPAFGPGDDRLLGLHGFAQTGKDTVANILKDHRFTRVAFADPIRKALYTLNPIIASDSRGRTFGLAEVVDDEGWEEAKKTPEVRRLLQEFGTEVGRQMLGNNVWLDLAKKKLGPHGKYVITDMRFQNEVDMVRELGGTLIKIKRPGYEPINGHVSDKGLPDDLFDHVIINDGTIDDLRRTVLDVVGI